jgi:hypothetical protein
VQAEDVHDSSTGATTTATPIGLAIDIEDGSGVPLSVRANQTFYMNQIDMRAHVEATVDEGVTGLFTAGDFATLDWHGTAFVDQAFVNSPNPDGTYTRRRFYRQATWMDEPSLYIIEQLDAQGRVRGVPIVVGDGLVDERTQGPDDTFFARRLRAIQLANDCATKQDCSTATNFTEEALVELRYANGPRPTFQLGADTTQLRVVWTENAGHPYVIPVTQVANPTWDYNFNIAIDATDPPQADGTYLPGQTVHFTFSLRDGAGNDLTSNGLLPSYADYVDGTDAPGIDYWNQAEPHWTYYRRKHRERQLIAAIDGPVQSVGPLRRTYDFIDAVLDNPDNSLVIATPSQDGFFAAAALVPNGYVLLGIDPADTPIPNTFQFTLPSDAQPGTYKVALKARRTYLGQDLPEVAVINLQVGTPVETHANLNTGGCTDCHHGGDKLNDMSHGFSVNQRDVCTTCHAPLPFEPEGPIYVRVHFIHSRSGRLDANPEQCSLCHLDNAGIQRTSQSACMSCHKSYPADHVAKYGPIVDMYIGGGLDGPTGIVDTPFQQCTSTCHRTHPMSGLDGPANAP